MSAVLDHEADAPTGFVPRAHEVAEQDRAVAGFRAMECERKLWRLFTVAGGWVFGVCMTVMAGGAVALLVHRPAPHDRLIAVPLGNETPYQPPVLVEDLPRSRSDILLRHSLREFIKANESYSWEGDRHNYNLVSAMSDPALRAKFQAIRNDKKNPENPAVIYGTGPGAGKADVIAMKINIDEASPNAPTAQIVVRITTPGKPDRTVSKTASMTWAPPPAGGWETDQDPIPLEIQQQYDPMGITIGHYTSYPDLRTAQ